MGDYYQKPKVKSFSVIKLYQLSAFIFLFLFVSNISQACKLSVRLYPFTPLAMKSSNHQWSGLNADFTKTLFSKINCKFKFVEMPFARGLVMLRMGKLDSMFDLTKLAERENDIFFIGPLREETIVFVTHSKLKHSITSMEQLIDIKGEVGYRRGTYIGKKFNDLMATDAKFAKKIKPISNTDSMIELLNKGRIIGFFDEKLHLQDKIANDVKFKGIIIQPMKVVSQPVFMGFSKKSVPDNLKAQLFKANEELIKDGTYKKIVQGYLN